MLPLDLVIALLLASFAVLVYHGATVLMAYQIPRLLPTTPSPRARWPRVTAVIAARNEETDIGACLDSLLLQDYPDLEVIVVDGASTDRTREIVRAHSPRVRLIEEPPLPAGWVGKSWACSLGAQAASGEYLLFTDADVRYDPSTLRTTLEYGEREGADLVTLGGRLEMVTWWERVILPFMVQLVLTYFRTPRVNEPLSKAAMANGQYILVRRTAYEAVGGHAAIRGAVLEDVRLAQEFRRSGKVLRIAFARELITTRMYRNRPEMVEGLLKTVHGPRFSAVRQAVFLVGLVGLYWVPLLVLPFGILAGSWPVAAMGALLWGALIAKHVGFSRVVGGRDVDGLWFPVAVGFYLVLIWISLVRGIQRRPISWKGRSYPIDA
jgi:chlorobactene glucosyltransferase